MRDSGFAVLGTCMVNLRLISPALRSSPTVFFRWNVIKSSLMTVAAFAGNGYSEMPWNSSLKASSFLMPIARCLWNSICCYLVRSAKDAFDSCSSDLPSSPLLWLTVGTSWISTLASRSSSDSCCTYRF